MAYTRKTIDEWQLHVNYGYGWEHEISEISLFLIKQRRKEYNENCPQYRTKIVCRRVTMAKLEELAK